LVGEGVIFVGDQQDGGRKRQISTPVSAFSAIVGVSLKCVLAIHLWFRQNIYLEKLPPSSELFGRPLTK
jgi:hypothetical protein